MDQANPASGIAHDTLADEDVSSVVDNYESKKLAGICVRKGCKRAAAEDSCLCPRHHRDQKRRRRDWARKQRALWAAQEACTNCGNPRRAPDSNWCAGCLIERGKVRHQDVNRVVDNHSRRVAERRIEWQDSPTNQGRKNRLRGGKRGRRSVADDDKERLLALHKFLGKADEGYGYALSPQVLAMGAIQRRDALEAALSWVMLAVRTGVEMLKANKYPVPEEADHLVFVDEDK